MFNLQNIDVQGTELNVSIFYAVTIFFKKIPYPKNTVDGRNPAPPGMVKTL